MLPGTFVEMFGQQKLQNKGFSKVSSSMTRFRGAIFPLSSFTMPVVIDVTSPASILKTKQNEVGVNK